MSNVRPERVAIGAQVRVWRKRRRLSQIQLAERAGITQSTLSNYENGKREPSIGTLIRIAEELDVSLDVLAGRAAPPA